MITVNFCGYNSMHKTTFDSRLPNGFDDYLLLLIKTESFFEKDGVVVNMPPNTVILWDIHSYIHYGCKEPHFNDDWIQFALQGEDAGILKKLEIPLDKPFTLPNMDSLTEYSKLIVLEDLSSHPYKLDVIHSLMHALLFSLANQLHADPNVHSSNKYFHPMNELRMEIMNAPYRQWNASYFAEQLHISVSYFQHLYKTFFETTCAQDIIAARIKHAQFYLRTTEMSVHALALFCGYENEIHFMRQFKQMTGMTPSQYRASCYPQDNKASSPP